MTANAADLGWWSRFLAQPKDSPLKTLLVALCVSLVCSIMVTFTAITLRSSNVVPASEHARQLKILRQSGLVEEGQDSETADVRLETRVVHLASGQYVKDLPAELADPLTASHDNTLFELIPAELDQAKLGQRLQHSLVHLVWRDNRLSNIVLPVYGAGMWSTLYGYLSLETDGNTVVDLRFYVNQETPGIGDRIDNRQWRLSWRGKQIYDQSGSVRIKIPRQVLPASNPAARFQIDGLSGATRTTEGVINLVHYWLGEHGFKPYLQRFHPLEDEP